MTYLKQQKIISYFRLQPLAENGVMIDFNVTEILRFWNLTNMAWNCLLTPILGHYFPQSASCFILTPKGTSLCGNSSFELLSVCARAVTWPMERTEKKWQEKKSQKRYISRIWREPPAKPICPKICTWRDILDLITCAKFQNEILRGCNSTGGWNSHFP